MLRIRSAAAPSERRYRRAGTLLERSRHVATAPLPVVSADCAISPEEIAERVLSGPRYTSYPPATELRPRGDAEARAELGRIGAAGERVSLYVHLPFCRSLCWYCGCNVVATRDRSRGTGYVDTLTTELVLLRQALGEHASTPVTEISLGGGSPNFLHADDLRRLIAAIDKFLPPTSDARRSVELDPRDTDLDQLDALAGGGFRSLSVGVQDFSEPVQDAIHRHQSVAQTRKLLTAARAAGFDDVNVDVVYGLPRQTEETFRSTLEALVELGPDRIALFGYAHLPERRPHQRLVERAGRVLDTYERASLLLLGNQVLRAAGYQAIGLDHFARPGSPLALAADAGELTRNFQGYTVRRADAVLGVGVTAISTTEHQLWQHHGALPAWEEAIAAGQLPVALGFTLDADDRVRRDVIERLMCDGAVDGTAIGARYQLDFASYFRRELSALGAMPDLVRVEPERPRLVASELGRLLIRNVAMVFDRRLSEREGTFSPTV